VEAVLIALLLFRRYAGAKRVRQNGPEIEGGNVIAGRQESAKTANRFFTTINREDVRATFVLTITYIDRR
jgi:hypothetical protein